eukprot:scaffold4782_cov32-Tisochrysis_lutea.AAC.1
MLQSPHSRNRAPCLARAARQSEPLPRPPPEAESPSSPVGGCPLCANQRPIAAVAVAYGVDVRDASFLVVEHAAHAEKSSLSPAQHRRLPRGNHRRPARPFTSTRQGEPRRGRDEEQRAP